MFLCLKARRFMRSSHLLPLLTRQHSNVIAFSHTIQRFHLHSLSERLTAVVTAVSTALFCSRRQLSAKPVKKWPPSSPYLTADGRPGRTSWRPWPDYGRLYPSIRPDPPTCLLWWSSLGIVVFRIVIACRLVGNRGRLFVGCWWGGYRMTQVIRQSISLLLQIWSMVALYT